MFPNQKTLKGKFVLIDLQTGQRSLGLNGEVQYYDTEEEARIVCGMYELKNFWVVELKYYYTEN